MKIILNERELAEEIIFNRQLGNRPTDALTYVAKYYFAEGYKKAAVRDKLEIFLFQCMPTASPNKWSERIDSAVRFAQKHPAVVLDHIDVTEAELKVVAAMEGKQRRRLAFTLLCIAKYWNAVNPTKNNNWVNEEDREIMKMANVSTSVDRQSTMYREMRDAGLITFSKKVDNLNVRVNYINEGSPVAMRITDFRNLGYQYMMYLGEPYIQCAQCGLTVKKKSNPHKYCPECAAEMYVRQSVESVMRRRVKK